MPDPTLIHAIPGGLQKTLDKNIAAGETVLVALKGAFKEALICTDRRILIMKAGFMTGQTFGSEVFQLSYSSIASAQVKYRILSGYFEVSTGGMQNTDKSYWSQDKALDPAKAPNCVSLNSRRQADLFRRACTFISEHIDLYRRSPVMSPVQNSEVSPLDISSAIERLWKLKLEGAIDQSEFEAAKSRLLRDRV